VANATKACELSDWKVGLVVEKLAAAYAESGDFEKAVKYQKQALEDKAARKYDGEKMQMRLKLYEQKKPYREP
jgi:hypothetical protein